MPVRELSGDLLRARLSRSYLAASHFFRKFNGRSYWSRRRQTVNKVIGAYPIRSTEKLRFAETDRNGHISTAFFTVCCQNARMEVLSDPNRAPVPNGAYCVITGLQLDFLAEMPGTVEIGTRVEHIGRWSIVLMQGLFLSSRCVARAKSIVVLIDAATRRATPLPAPLINALHEIRQYGFHNRFSVAFRVRSAIKGVLVRR
jgi:acyl-CoA thioester hydrolase